MGISRRLRNIAKSQLSALKERLDRIDAEDISVDDPIRAQRDALRELEDPTDLRLARRTPEEIASGAPAARNVPQPTSASVASVSSTPLVVHYRRLGLPDGSDLSAIEAAYAGFRERCAPERFPAGSDDQKTAEEIFRRVQESYDALRDSLDSSAGRFDKLEL